ncbi:hypothetical protein AQUCO_00100409v1 [Aquilegia coerulea]|uniref:Peptidase S9 prolyl oligopeptidase catalytic domain-containing protein n=1 Tax=Aquilegia coerulea TaxID=218851 RepID=A0A2G5FAG1_AQUCA|nr:hypothetical protein AQUCO_00100409v1 [Aquilegia coerulea]
MEEKSQQTKPITTTSREEEVEEAVTSVQKKLRSEFLEVLQSRRRKSHEVPLSVEIGKPISDPMYQESPRPTFSEAMESCPKEENVENFKELLKEENLYLITEEGEQGRLPVLILSTNENKEQKRPAIVFLHSTHKCKEWLRPLLEAYASRGYIAIAIDSRYHGERAKNLTTYRDALVQSWKNGDTMPFIFDTVWDLIKLADYLTQREDIDHSKIGITGESLGEAALDLGKNGIDAEVVEKVWDRIAPGLASQFDSPYTIPAISPRPLLILNGAEDPRCPLEGLDTPVSRARDSYKAVPENFELIAQPGIGHQMTSLMVKEASCWFDKFLK